MYDVVKLDDPIKLGADVQTTNEIDVSYLKKDRNIDCKIHDLGYGIQIVAICPRNNIKRTYNIPYHKVRYMLNSQNLNKEEG